MKPRLQQHPKDNITLLNDDETNVASDGDDQGSTFSFIKADSTTNNINKPKLKSDF